MEWIFNYDSPIYLQIMDIVKHEIASGGMKAGDKLPSVRELALLANVNPNTMQKALSELEREGLVYSQRTSGRFITTNEDILKSLHNDIPSEHVKTYYDNMKKLGYSEKEMVEILKKFIEDEKGKA